MTRTSIFVGFGLVWVAAGQAQQEQAVQVMAHAESRRDTLTIVAGDGRVLASYVPGNARLSRVSVAPTETYVAALEHIVIPQSFSRPHVVVLSREGAVVARSKRVARTYVWCCGGQQVAYIAGEPGEHGVAPRGIYILDVRTGIETPLPGLETPLEIEWVERTRSLYLKVPGRVTVFSYELASRRFMPTRHRDVNFSPDGRYYLHFTDDNDLITRLYDANRDVDLGLPTPSELGLTGEWRPHISGFHWFSQSGSSNEELRIVGWAFDRQAILLFTHNRVTPRADSPRTGLRTRPPALQSATRDPIQHLLFDVRSRRVVGRIHGALLPWAAPRGALAFEAAGRVSAITRVP